MFWLTTVRMLPFYAGGLHALLYLVDVPGWRDLTLGVGGFLRGFPAVSGSSDALASRLAVDPRHAAALLVAGSALFLVARAALLLVAAEGRRRGAVLAAGPAARDRDRFETARSRRARADEHRDPRVAARDCALGGRRAEAERVDPRGRSGWRGWRSRSGAGRAEGFDEASAWNPYHGAFWAPLLAVSFVLAIVAFLWIPARIEDGAFTVSLGAKSNNVEVLWAESGDTCCSAAAMRGSTAC